MRKLACCVLVATVWLLVSLASREVRASGLDVNANLDCELTAALLGLPETETKLYAQVCRAHQVDTAADASKLYKAMDRLLRLGGWQANLALTRLGNIEDPTVQPRGPLEQQLERLVAQLAVKPDKRSTCVPRDVIARFHAKRMRGEAAHISVAELNDGCPPPNDPVETLDLVVLAYHGAPTDKIEAHYLDNSHPWLVREVPPVVYEGTPEVQLLLVPRNQRILVSVKQAQYDLAWTEVRLALGDGRISAKAPATADARPSTCLQVAAAFGDSASSKEDADAKRKTKANTPPVLFVDGQSREWSELRRPKDPKRWGGTASLILDLPEGEHEIVLVPRLQDKPVGSAVSQGHLVERSLMLTANDSRCVTLDFDVSGLDRDSRFGIVDVSIDEACAAKGITRAGIRDHVSTELIDLGMDVRSLDVLGDSVQAFFQLRTRLETPKTTVGVGGDRGSSGDRARLTQIAGETARQGVDQLLSLELRCSTTDDTVTLTATKIDLHKYSVSDKDSAAGTDLREVIKTHSASVPRTALRHGFDRVLGGLLDTGYIRLARGSAVKRRDAHTPLLVSLETSAKHTGGVDFSVEVFKSDELQASRARNDLCATVSAYNSLAPGAYPPELTVPLIRRRRVVFEDEYEITPTSISQWDPVHSTRVDEALDLGGLPVGTWLVVATMSSGSTELQSLTCFEVQETSREWWAQLEGGSRIRGRYLNPRYAPRQDQINYLQATTGVRFDMFRFGRYGGEIGYGLTQYTADSLPSWDNVNQVGLEGSYEWTRHSILFGGVVGAELPTSKCEWRRQLQKHPERVVLDECGSVSSRFNIFLDLHTVFDFGLIDLSRLPTEIRNQSLLFNPDLDVGLQTGFRVAISQDSRMGFFAGVWFTDVVSAARVRFKPDLIRGFDFDYSVRWMFGAEYSLGWKFK